MFRVWNLVQYESLCKEFPIIKRIVDYDMAKKAILNDYPIEVYIQRLDTANIQQKSKKYFNDENDWIEWSWHMVDYDNNTHTDIIPFGYSLVDAFWINPNHVMGKLYVYSVISPKSITLWIYKAKTSLDTLVDSLKEFYSNKIKQELQ